MVSRYKNQAKCWPVEKFIKLKAKYVIKNIFYMIYNKKYMFLSCSVKTKSVVLRLLGDFIIEKSLISSLEAFVISHDLFVRCGFDFKRPIAFLSNERDMMRNAIT